MPSLETSFFDRLKDLAAWEMLQGPQRQAEAKRLCRLLQSARPKECPQEPDEYTRILQTCPPARRDQPVAPDQDRILGAWMGRAAGCLLGMPFEDWKRAPMQAFLTETGNYPPRRFARSDAPDLRKKYAIDNTQGTGRFFAEQVTRMPEDDDTNYTVLGLRVLETCGFGFTTEQVAGAWLDRLPLNRTFTAERAAMANLIRGVPVMQAGEIDNPYREWIGAQIRADLYGYVCPGQPRRAAELAYRDAYLSHRRNGIYGAMFVATMLAEAAVTRNMSEIINAGLEQIPAESRLSKAVQDVQRMYRRAAGWQAVVDEVHRRYDENNGHGSVHVVSNAMLVVNALLHARDEIWEAIGIAVAGGMDTDCNGATAGSVMGMVLGAQNLPPEIKETLGEEMIARVDEAGIVRFDDMARRTYQLALQKEENFMCSIG